MKNTLGLPDWAVHFFVGVGIGTVLFWGGQLVIFVIKQIVAGGE